MSEQKCHGEELFSTRVHAGSRTYFIDVQRAATGVKYIKIGESRRGEGKRHEHHRVMVFEEYFTEFLHALTEAVPFMRPDPLPSQISVVRKEHPRAYEKWTEEEDARLRSMFGAGKDAAEMAAVLQRQRGAIRSRLRKLGLLS